MSADGPVRPTGQTAGPGQASGWPVWSGPVPPLAEGFTARPDTMPDLEIALVPGATVVLVPDQAPGSAQDWRASSGKTQLARVIHIHHRHLPKSKWGMIGDPPAETDDYGDLAGTRGGQRRSRRYQHRQSERYTQQRIHLRGTDGDGTFGNIVEGEADHRTGV